MSVQMFCFAKRLWEQPGFPLGFARVLCWSVFLGETHEAYPYQSGTASWSMILGKTDEFSRLDHVQQVTFQRDFRVFSRRFVGGPCSANLIHSTFATAAMVLKSRMFSNRLGGSGRKSQHCSSLLVDLFCYLHFNIYIYTVYPRACCLLVDSRGHPNPRFSLVQSLSGFMVITFGPQ